MTLRSPATSSVSVDRGRELSLNVSPSEGNAWAGEIDWGETGETEGEDRPRTRKFQHTSALLQSLGYVLAAVGPLINLPRPSSPVLAGRQRSFLGSSSLVDRRVGHCQRRWGARGVDRGGSADGVSLAAHSSQPGSHVISSSVPLRPQSREDFSIGAAAASSQPHLNCVPVDGGGVEEACANCGKQGSDTVKLKDCTACRLVKYCGVDCQRAHRKQHKKACKKRAAELKDEELYSQGHEWPEGDFCPICTLPIPLPMSKYSRFNTCCMKRVCIGCDYAAQKRGMQDCAFCRTPIPDNDADVLAMIQARVAKKDPVAINHLAQKYFYGRLGLQKDMGKAVELWAEAAELGLVDSLFRLGHAFDRGEGVQEDKAKAAKFYEKAAMQGHAKSRYNLGCYEGQTGNHDRALRHLLISAKMGDSHSLEAIKTAFKAGLATKEQYAEALKGY
ncbi:hypothetical protein THAOC_36342, partial [Thalassiosira oceanica]